MHPHMSSSLSQQDLASIGRENSFSFAPYTESPEISPIHTTPSFEVSRTEYAENLPFSVTYAELPSINTSYGDSIDSDDSCDIGPCDIGPCDIGPSVTDFSDHKTWRELSDSMEKYYQNLKNAPTPKYFYISCIFYVKTDSDGMHLCTLEESMEDGVSQETTQILVGLYKTIYDLKCNFSGVFDSSQLFPLSML